MFSFFIHFMQKTNYVSLWGSEEQAQPHSKQSVDEAEADMVT